MYLEKRKVASQRIHHELRMKKKAFHKLYGNWHCPSFDKNAEEAKKDAWEAAARIKNNLTVCSCSMCCNPRNNQYNSKKAKLTRQENSFLDVASSQDM